MYFIRLSWQSLTTGKLSAIWVALRFLLNSIMKQEFVKTFPFLFHTYCTHNQKRATTTPLLFLLLFSDVSSTYKCYKKNPVSIQSNRRRKWNVRLFFILSLCHPSPPSQEKAQVFKTIYRLMYKSYDTFFFVTRERKKKTRQDGRKCIFTFKRSMQNVLVALNVIITTKQN